MGTSKFEGYALCVADYEENYLYGLCENNELSGISSLVKAAGGQTVRSSVPNAFESESEPETEDTFFHDIRAEYRQSSGRVNPPVMRVRVTVEVETLSDEESGKVWQEHRAAQEARFAKALTPDEGDTLEELEDP